MREKSRLIPTDSQTSRLGVRGRVEEAERIPAKLVGRGCREHFNGGHWVAAEQKMTAVTLKLNRILNAQLDRALPPFKISDGCTGRNVR